MITANAPPAAASTYQCFCTQPLSSLFSGVGGDGGVGEGGVGDGGEGVGTTPDGHFDEVSVQAGFVWESPEKMESPDPRRRLLDSDELQSLGVVLKLRSN